MTKIVKAVQRSFKELLAACKQHETNPDFNENNFPLEPVADDEDEWEVYEYHFKKTVNGLKAFDKLQKLGYRLCDVRRAMEYIANGRLNDQMDHPIIITSQWRHPIGVYFTPFFFGVWNKRNMNLFSLNNNLDPIYGWLVLRKKMV